MTPSSPLVLSLFPGIGLLDRAFEEEGFTVVRGPDVLWGGDIRRFHPPPGVFDGIIGGPPCQAFSALAHLVRANGHTPHFGNLIPEFERCVSAARPRWFLMENVIAAPLPVVDGYETSEYLLNNRYFGAEQNRRRRFTWGVQGETSASPLIFDVELFEAPLVCVAVSSNVGGYSAEQASAAHAVLADRRAVPVKIGGSGKLKPGAVTSSDGSGKVKQVRYSLADACELQGLPRDFLSDAPFTSEGKLKAVANGVPLPMGRAVARAVKRAMA